MTLSEQYQNLIVYCGNIGKIGIPNTHLDDRSPPALVQPLQ
jgi:hypothetical protein